MKNLLRAAAIAVASTALVAGATTTATAAPGDSASIGVAPVTLNGFKGTTSKVVPVTLQTSRPTLTIVYATVNVNGTPVGQATVTSSGFIYQQAWGAGTVTLTGLTDSRRQAVAGASNAFPVRYGVEGSSGIHVRKKGKKLTFRVKARYIDNRGVAVGIRRATIQVHKKGKWRTLKNVRLKANGTRTYKRSDSKKRKYRLVVKTTGLYQGGSTKGLRI
jgi:hypothetical protein